jgi:VanZ family protein
MPHHKTAAWPLSLAFIALIVYASLYPFTGWRDQDIPPWHYLLADWPRYWSGFDVMANTLGYLPLGFLLALAILRTSHRAPVWWATLSAGLLSLLMESLQSYLPARVPSNVDWLLNVSGAWFGAILAALLERMGAIARWHRWRARWFVSDAQGGLALLALWPVALLFPAAVPFGLGQVYERMESGLANALVNTPFLEWLPLRELELQPLVPGAEMVCVAMGALIPCLLGFCVIPASARRVLLVLAVLMTGVVATMLSAAMSYGPTHAWAWLSLPVQTGIGLAAVLSLMLVPVPARVCASLMLLALGIYLSIINLAPASAYFANTLQTWEQGRFIRFHGVGQWLGWLWPYGSLLYALSRVWSQPR